MAHTGRHHPTPTLVPAQGFDKSHRGRTGTRARFGHRRETYSGRRAGPSGPADPSTARRDSRTWLDSDSDRQSAYTLDTYYTGTSSCSEYRCPCCIYEFASAYASNGRCKAKTPRVCLCLARPACTGYRAGWADGASDGVEACVAHAGYG